MGKELLVGVVVILLSIRTMNSQPRQISHTSTSHQPSPSFTQKHCPFHDSMNDNHARLSPALVETIAGLTAGAAATLAAHPLDVIKTRLQSQFPTELSLIHWMY
jgi:hypothetical protein